MNTTAIAPQQVAAVTELEMIETYVNGFWRLGCTRGFMVVVCHAHSNYHSLQMLGIRLDSMNALTKERGHLLLVFSTEQEARDARRTLQESEISAYLFIHGERVKS